jgi:hypothetical protein
MDTLISLAADLIRTAGLRAMQRHAKRGYMPMPVTPVHEDVLYFFERVSCGTMNGWSCCGHGMRFYAGLLEYIYSVFGRLLAIWAVVSVFSPRVSPKVARERACPCLASIKVGLS